MSKIGDRIALESRGGPRTGVITAVRDPMITVQWDSGGETSLVPGGRPQTCRDRSAPILTDEGGAPHQEVSDQDRLVAR